MIMISITYDAADGFFVSNHIGRTAFSAIAKAAAEIGILLLRPETLIKATSDILEYGLPYGRTLFLFLPILILGTDSLRLAQAVRELLAASTAIFFFTKCRNEYCGLYYAA